MLQKVLYLLVLEWLVFLVLDVNQFNDIEGVIWSEFIQRDRVLVLRFEHITVLTWAIGSNKIILTTVLYFSIYEIGWGMSKMF